MKTASVGATRVSSSEWRVQTTLLPPPSGGRRVLQNTGPGSQGDVARVVRRVLRAQVRQYS